MELYNVKGEIHMKNKLTTILLTVILLTTALPVYAHAEECTEHQWGEWYEISSPACLLNGIEGRNCKNCYERELRSIPATGHQWGEWTTGEEATCSRYGYKTRVCAVCNISERETISPTYEHQWGEWEVEEEPTCEKHGYKIKECNICHDKEEEEIPATGKHSWGEWETIKEATAISKGVQSRFCIDCDEEKRRTTPKLKASITLEEKTATVESGKNHKIRIKSKTYGDKIKKWTSSNKKVATVDSHGKVTGKQTGTATIILKMKSGVTAKCKITVTQSKHSTNSQPGKSHSNGSGSHSGGNSTNAPSSGYVWIPNTGSKYHKTSTCSGMKNPSEVTVKEAKNAGYEPCSKCY